MQSQEPFSLISEAGSQPNIRIIRVSGPILLQHVFELQDELRVAPAPFTILDLTGVPFMDSAGMGAIINFYVSSQKAKRKFIVTGVNDRVGALFALTHVDTLITVRPTIADAENS